MDHYGLTKVIYQDAQESLLAAIGGHFNTLIENKGMMKSASADYHSIFTEEDYEAHKPDKDHFMQHVIALGGWPTYPPNRNQDAFPSASLEKYHDTFVKHGHFYREHRHEDPSLAIGTIVKSAYNKPLDRVELLVHGHKKKAAEEYELAKQGKELAYSMSARLKHDRCSCCGNMAKSAAAYCDHLKKHMGQYIPTFKKYAFAINDEPRFFDISRVGRPADRIAHYIAYKFSEDEEMKKAASADTSSIIIPGYLAAELEGVRTRTISDFKDTLVKLAAAETWFADNLKQKRNDPEWHYFFSVLKTACQDNTLNGDFKKVASLRPGTLFGKLAETAALLPAKELFEYAGYDGEVVKLANIHNSMLKDEQCDATLDELTPLFSGFGKKASDCDPEDSDEVDGIMEEMAQKFSCKMEPTQQKTITIIIKSGSANTGFAEYDKTRSLDIFEQSYAAYQVAAFEDMVKRGFEDQDLLAKTFVAMNFYRNS
jgi:hypothetical protein